MPPPKARGDSRDRTEQMEEADDKEKATNAIFWTRRSYCNHELTANVASIPRPHEIGPDNSQSRTGRSHRAYPFHAELLTTREGGERHCLQLCSHRRAHQAPGDSLDPSSQRRPWAQQQIPEQKNLIKGCRRQERVRVRIIRMCHIRV